MVLKTELCRFSGAEIYPGRGIRFICSDSQVFLFLNSKCKRPVLPQMEPKNRETEPILVGSGFARFQSLEIIKPTRILSPQFGLGSYFFSGKPEQSQPYNFS